MSIFDYFPRGGRKGEGYRALTNHGIYWFDRPSRRMSAAGAYCSVAYMSCEMAKARPISSLPVHVYVTAPDGSRFEDVRHPVARLLKWRWNPHMTAKDGLRWIILRRDTFGTAYVRVEWRKGNPVALWPIMCDVIVLHNDENNLLYDVIGDDVTPAGRYLPHEILAFKSPVSEDGVHGKSVLSIAAESIGLSVDLEKFYAALIRNGSHFPGYLETDQTLRPPDFEAIKASLEGSSGIMDAGKVRIFDRGLKYRQCSLTMADMSLIEQQTWVLQQVCRATCVPPQEVYDLSHATYSNYEQAALNFAQKTLLPEVTDFECVFHDLFDAMGDPTSYVKFDLSGLQRGDFATRMEGYRIGRYGGWFTMNDILRMEDMEPAVGGDTYLIPRAYALLLPDGTVETVEGKTADATGVSVLLDDARNRISERARNEKDKDKARDFAAKVLLPFANAALMTGSEFDLEREIERSLNA